MVKVRLNRVRGLTAGDMMELPEGALATTVTHSAFAGGYIVAWLEEAKE